MKTLSTKEVAEFCKVQIRTVVKWFDGNRLHGHRIPGTSRVKFVAQDVVEFLIKHGMEVPLALSSQAYCERCEKESCAK
jgi:excisionase family DNA binding protein